MTSQIQIEARLFDGRKLIKTMSADAASGAHWTFDDGRPARAETCIQMIAAGVIEPIQDGLFPDTSQTYQLAPYRAPLAEFVTERHGPDWVVAKRKTKKLAEQYRTIIKPREFAASEREWKARAALAA